MSSSSSSSVLIAAVKKEALKRQAEIDDIRELVLDGVKIKQFSEEDKAFLEKECGRNLLSLSLNETRLTNLTNFPNLPNLRCLEIQDNKLTDNSANLFETLSHFSNLVKFAVAGNKIKKLETLEKIITPMQQLRALYVEMNPVVDEAEEKEQLTALYKALFAKVPTLRLIDCVDPNGNPLEEDEIDLYGGVVESESEGEEEEEIELGDFYNHDYQQENDEDDGDFVPVAPDEPDSVDEEESEGEDEDEVVPETAPTTAATESEGGAKQGSSSSRRSSRELIITTRRKGSSDGSSSSNLSAPVSSPPVKRGRVENILQQVESVKRKK